MSGIDWAKAKRKAAASQIRADDALEGRSKLVGRQIFGLDCPKCGGQTVQRSRARDGHKFFGCRKYPRCKGAYEPPVT